MTQWCCVPLCVNVQLFQAIILCMTLKGYAQVSQRNTGRKVPIFSCHSELNHSLVFYFPVNCILWCQYILFFPSLTIMSVMNRYRALVSPFHSLLLRRCTFFIFIICHYKKWAIFVTTAVFSNFYSTNSSQSPFNGISINLLNGFKNSLTLMWVSEILMWTLKTCSRCAQFDRISSVSARLSRDWAWWS